MLIGISHIGIAVKDLDEAIKTYCEVLGAKLEEVQRAPEAGMAAAMLSVGSNKIELMEPIGTEGAIAKFLESRGEGIQHICIEVDDIDKTLESLAAKGIRLIDEKARKGLEGRIAFIHPRSMNGVLIELLERSES